MEKNPQSDLVQPNERIDDLQNGFYVIQNPEKFCFGMDAVLLSGFANIRKNETVLDMGTGTGIIPILLKSTSHSCHKDDRKVANEHNRRNHHKEILEPWYNYTRYNSLPANS